MCKIHEKKEIIILQTTYNLMRNIFFQRVWEQCKGDYWTLIWNTDLTCFLPFPCHSSAGVPVAVNPINYFSAIIVI